MESTIKPGDIVTLKSGGPRMTVQSVNGRSAECAWFVRYADDGYGPLQGARFDLDALTTTQN